MLKKKRLFALLLSLIMIFSSMTTAFAAETTETLETESTVTQETEVETEADASTWLPEDFTYGTETFELYPASEESKKIYVDAWVVTGLSESGTAKLAENTDLVIPATDPDGTKVQGVGKNAFNKKGLTSVTFPENVKASYDDTTWDTTGKGLTERGDFFIGYAAFRYNNFTTLELPEGVIHIDTYAFANNTSLSSVTFPKSVMQIRSGAFYKDSLTSATFADVNDFGLQLDTQAFMGNQLTAVQLPSNTEKLHKWTFIQNTGMETITSGTSAEKKGGLVYLYIDAEEIGNYATTDTVVHKIILGKMPVPWCADHFTYAEDGTTILGLSDLGKEKIKENPAVIIPEGVTALGDGTNMTGIFVYPETVDGVTTYYAPESVSLPSTLTTIGKWTFALNPNLTYVSEMTEITLPDGLVSIGQTAFQNSKLTSIIIPDSVTTMGNGAFTGSGSLTSVTLSKNVKNIPASAFNAGSSTTMSLKELVIPEGVETIGNTAFTGAHIENLILPNSLTEIGTSAFANHKLTEVTIPASVTKIGNYAFRAIQEGYTGFLKTVNLNEGLETIGREAFAGGAITEITLPSTVVLSTKNKVADCIFGNAKTPASPIVTVYVNDRTKAAPAGEEGSYNTEFANSYSHVVVFKGIDIAASTATLAYETVEYTGNAFTPVVTIKGLVEGTDYTVEYQNNVEAGTATVVITGTGKYEGTITKTFTIKEKPADSEDTEKEEKPVRALVKRVKSLSNALSRLFSSIKRLFRWF